MTTRRLYRAIKDHQDAEALYQAAVLNNWGPNKSLRHNDPLLLRKRETRVELELAMIEAHAIIGCSDKREVAVMVRLAGERDVARFMLQSLVAQGFELERNQGQWRASPASILESLFEEEEFVVRVRANPNEAGWNDEGWIELILGNSPEELIADYTTNLEQYLTPTFKFIKEFYDNTYIIEGGIT